VQRSARAALLSESLLLGLAGGTLGVLFAQAGIGLLRRMAPVGLPRVDDIAINGLVLLFTLTLSVVTALMFGLLPAVRFGTLNFHVLKDAGRSVSDAPGPHRTQNMLVVAQVALALVLLIVSALLGVAIGVASAYGLTRVITSFLFGVSARDPVVFVSVPLVLSGVALLGVWLPARRAARVDPVVALRME
jgi:ABC-type antimicrobial peptide transport system permease subunit